MKNRNPGFESGNYWVVCDRCGLDYRIRETRKTWDNLLVCEECWETKHPQDYVAPKRDNIIVPIARPEPVGSFRTTTLSSAAAKGDTTISVASMAHIADDDPLGVYLDSGVTQWFQVTNEVTYVKLNEGLNYNASSGNKVTTMEVTGGDTFIDPTSVTAEDL